LTRQASDGKTCPETIVRWYEIKDKCGNRTEAAEIIKVEDKIPPSLKCPADVSYDAGLDNLKDLTGLAYAETEKQILPSSYAQLDILVSDNCLIEKVTYKDEISGFCPIEILRTYSANDACGNLSTGTQKIELTRGITLSETHENNGAGNLNSGKIDLEVSGGVPPYQFQWSNGETTEDIENLPSGTYLVEVRDSNECTASLEINIESELASINIICPSTLTISCKKDIDQSVYSDFTEFITASGSIFSECGIDTNTFVWAGDEIVNGSGCLNMDRTYEVNDSCGTIAFCIQSIIITDDVPPVLNCPEENADIGENKPEQYESYSAFVEAGGFADDNCGIDESSFEWINDSSDGNANPETLTRTYQIADFCGNISSCVQTIKLYDNSGIFINCPLDMTILCSENKPNAPLTYADFIAESGFAGSLPDFPIVESSFQVETVENNGPGNCDEYITRKYSIMNKNGDIAACEQQIAVQNSTLIEINCPENFTIDKNDKLPEAYNSLHDFILAGGYLSDNCGIDSFSFGLLSEYKDTILSPQILERTYFVSDVCGNQNLCFQNINIENTTQTFDNKLDEQFKIKVFPNPTKGKFIFEVEGIKNKEVTLSIYNSIGERIAQDKLVSVNGLLEKDMDLSGISKGVYYLKITDGNKSYTRSIIVE
jgi:hypothetical protein